MKNKALLATLLIIAISGTGYYFQQREANAGSPEESAPQAPQSMPVTVEKVSAKPIQIWNQYSARLEAVDFAEIRPQVSGTISEVKFEDGQLVEKGEILYVIDPRPYQASVNQAEAILAGAKNQAALAWKELKRAKKLIKTSAVSERILDERSNAHSVAVAAIEAAKASLDSGKINLDYAYLKAPISGRIGRAEIKEGNLVEAGPNAPVLTSIVSTHSIYADFEVDEQSYLKYIRGIKTSNADTQIPVKLSVGDGILNYEGYIDSFDNQIDVTTGTIRARALFKNEDQYLLPGMFASVKMGTPSSADQIVIPEKAIGTDQSRKFVLIVNNDNIVEYREIKVGESMKGTRIITSGLNEGDMVITEGIIRIRPGMPVSPQIKDDKPQETASNAQ
jgi:multidrug efflux system membrane fusion protein